MPSSPASARSDEDEHARKLCKFPGSRLIFANYDPGSDVHVSAFDRLSLQERANRSTRIAVEIPPNGACIWRFVPRANREQGVRDEGIWPRQVNVCGDILELTQDEWDMYKLDPEYVCIVKNFPHLSTILRTPDEFRSPGGQTSPVPPLRYRIPKLFPHTRKFSQRQPDPQESDSESEWSDEDDDDNASADGMDLDPAVQRKHLDSDLLKKVRKNKADARKFRRAKNAQFKRRHPPRYNPEPQPEPEPIFIRTYVSPDVRMMTPQSSFTDLPPAPERPESPSPVRPPPAPSSNPRKRTVSVESDDEYAGSFDRSQEMDRNTAGMYDFSGEAKRSKLLSPSAIMNNLKQKRENRGKKRVEELKRRVQKRKDEIENRFMHELYTEAAQGRPNVFVDEDESMEQDARRAGSSRVHEEPEEPEELPSDPPMVDEEAERMARLAESRRKMAELEADRPLWEEAARQRAAREAEEQRRRAAEQRARVAQEEAARRAQKEEEERREAERVAAEQQAERSSVRKRREQMRTDVLRPYKSRFTPWTNYDAVDRFMKLSEAFDKLNFHRGDLIIFELIPWPMLNKPGTFGVGEIDWQAVERFFCFARSAITPANFKVVVDKTHKRFHPDRWRSRRVLACIDDEEEKECLEMAANTVAQALTPLWKEVTGR